MAAEHEHLTLDGMGDFGVRNGRLLWKGEEVVTKQRVSLRAYELTLATIVAIAAVVGAAWPVLVHLKLV